MVCQNQSIDDLDADLAHDLRVLVRERLVAGDSDDQVIAYIVSRYGEFVLLRPRMSWRNLVLWAALPSSSWSEGRLSCAARRPDPAPAQASLSEDEARLAGRYAGTVLTHATWGPGFRSGGALNITKVSCRGNGLQCEPPISWRRGCRANASRSKRIALMTTTPFAYADPLDGGCRVDRRCRRHRLRRCRFRNCSRPGRCRARRCPRPRALPTSSTVFRLPS